MNRKGFTLVELLTVVIILALIALLVVTGVTKLVKNSRENLSDIQLSSLKESASIWAVENTEFLPDDNECIYMTLGYLKDYGLVNEKVIDAKTSNDLSDNLFIKISAELSEYNKLIYNYEIIDNENHVENCKLIRVNHLAKENVEAVINPIINGAPVGITPTIDENRDFIPGSTFKIKVNDEDTDGSIFYVLSNDGDYVNLIAQQNITLTGTFTSEPQNNDEWYVETQDNRYGPQTAYTYLNTATSKWENIPIIESFNYLDEGNQSNSNYGYKSINTEYDSESGNYLTIITPFLTGYGDIVVYKNMRARLPYVSEITENTTCEIYSSEDSIGLCPTWMVNYLFNNSTSEKYYPSTSGKVNSIGNNYGYWLSSSVSDYSDRARSVYFSGYISNYFTDNNIGGIRPVISVLKSDLLRVMN